VKVPGDNRDMAARAAPEADVPLFAISDTSVGTLPSVKEAPHWAWRGPARPANSVGNWLFKTLYVCLMQSVQVTLGGNDVMPLNFAITFGMLSKLRVPSRFWMLVSVSVMQRVFVAMSFKQTTWRIAG